MKNWTIPGCGKFLRGLLLVLAVCILLGRGSAKEKPDAERAGKSEPEFDLSGGLLQGVLLEKQGEPVRLAFLVPRGKGTTARDYQVTIDWGDRGGTTRGKLQSAGPGAFEVVGRHAYATAGRYAVHVAVTGPAGSTLAVTSGIEVGDLFAGVLEARTVATIPARGRATDFNVTIDWGDGTPTTPGVVRRLGDKFLVRGSHAYKVNGPYTIRTLVMEGGEVYWRTGRTVRAVPPQPSDFKVSSFTFLPDQPATNLEIARFKVNNPYARAEDYGAVVIWADGSPPDTEVTVVGSGGSFRVLGSHTYSGGPYSLRVMLFQVWR